MHYIQKGIAPSIDVELQGVFSDLLDSLLKHYLASKTWDDIVAVQMINLFADNVYIFNLLNFTKLSSQIQLICSNTSFAVQEAYFRVWVQFMKCKESQQRIIQFVFEDFDTLILYLRDHVKIPTSIRLDIDRQRSDIFQHILSLI